MNLLDSTKVIVVIVLDTNVVSELMRPTPNFGVVDWVGRQPTIDVYFTSVSEAELRYGAQILPPGARRDRLFAEIEDMLMEDFRGRILHFNSAAARSYAVIAAGRRAAGHPIGVADCQIAAIARTHGASVATRDEEGFHGCGIDVINPWSS